jgi:hypothetical protein
MYRLKDVTMSRSMYRCRDVSKNVAENVSKNVSIYVTLFFNDVTRYMYRDTMRYINMPNLLVLLYDLFDDFYELGSIKPIYKVKYKRSFSSILNLYRTKRDQESYKCALVRFTFLDQKIITCLYNLYINRY